MVTLCTVEDLPSLIEGANEFYSSSKFLQKFDAATFCELWKCLIVGGMGVIHIDRDGDVVTGAIGGIIHKEPYNSEKVMAEMFWFVRPEYRGLGVRLYKAFEKWAVESGAASIQMVHLLDSMPDKVGQFYIRCGYEAVETRYTKRLK